MFGRSRHVPIASSIYEIIVSNQQHLLLSNIHADVFKAAAVTSFVAHGQGSSMSLKLGSGTIMTTLQASVIRDLPLKSYTIVRKLFKKKVKI